MTRTCWTYVLTLAVAFGVATPAQAGGIFSGHKGARVAGRAGAFTAKADDISAVLYNPAGIARVGTTLLQIGNRFSFHNASYTRAPTLDYGNLDDDGDPPLVEFDTVSNSAVPQLLDPMLGVLTNFGKLKNWGFGLVIMAPPGSARMEYPVNGGQNYMMVSRDAKSLNYSLSAAWKLKDIFGIGASVQWLHTPVLKYQIVIDSQPVNAPFNNPVSSEFDMLATIDGSDLFAFNAILGFWVRPIPAFEIAASGQIIPSAIKTKSTLELEPLDEDFDYDFTVQRDGELANDVTLTVPLPVTARIGARYRHIKKDKEIFDLELDLTYEAWSLVDQFTLDSRDLVVDIEGAGEVDIGEILIQKQWRHVFGVALGSDIAAIPDRFIVRMGAGYESPTATPAYTNVDFSTGHQLFAGLGFSVLIKGFEIAASYDFRGMLPVEVTEAEGKVYQQTPASPCEAPYTDTDDCHEAILGQPGPVVNAGRYTASTHAASLELLYRF